MDEITQALVLGIFGSLIATGVFVGLSELTRRILLPWYSDKIYRGVRIDGEWEEKSMSATGAPKLAMTLSLTQKADKIDGFYMHTNGDETDIYVLTGQLRDQYLHAIATPKSDRHIDGVTLLLRVDNVNSRQELEGGILYRVDTSEHYVMSQTGLKFVCKKG